MSPESSLESAPSPPILATDPALAALREERLAQLRVSLRSGQRRMADWRGGPLAVSAVPGSGKSTGMAGAAVLTIARAQLNPHRQLVIVTFTRSAVANIKAKIRQYLREASLPQGGFVVHTLHGLALQIASRHPELSGLNLDRMTLVSPNQSHRLIRSSVEQWVGENPEAYQRLLEGHHFDGEETERLRRQSVLRTEVLPDLAETVIREAKSSGLLPEDLAQLHEAAIVANVADDYGVLSIAADLYKHYQTLLRLQGWIDYDEMILAALRVLEQPPVRQFWQSQIYAVFEDEAQDSSPLQTRLLEILAADPTGINPPNLVRVGDPNQAINSTFTPADPLFFREFCESCQQEGRLVTMDQAGRSSPIILEAANFVLDWVNQRYRSPGGQRSQPLPFRPQAIRPVEAGDPQPEANPEATGRGLEIYTPPDVFQTVELIGKRAIELLTRHPEHNAAVLVRENKQGRFVAEQLSYLTEHGIQVYDVSQRERYSRVPSEMMALLQFIDRPHSPEFLKGALTVLTERQLIPTQDLNAIALSPEQFLYPGPLDTPASESVLVARRYCTALLRARLELPHYELLAFLALTLNYDATELATADKLADRVARQVVREEQGQRYVPAMASILDVLSDILNSEKFEPVETDESDSRYTRPRQLTIITMHKAKGLDWDYVFLPFLHEALIPGSLRIPPQAKFLGEFTLAEVTRAQIRASLHGNFPLPNLMTAWKRAEQLKVAEEFRLLYVAMTRAKRLLWMSAGRNAPFTWNRPDNLESKSPCPVIPALKRQFPECVVEMDEILRQ
ncbi:MAG: ATP-dependent helicase [Leptolyngbyaceae cyanobacterium bins.59]|nr:ATP-dependent helicase [Leptolyngbyaceae cyanobacterium bins.59]